MSDVSRKRRVTFLRFILYYYLFYFYSLCFFFELTPRDASFILFRLACNMRINYYYYRAL